MAQAPKTWILTGSPENFAATRERGFRLIGTKDGRRNQALETEPEVVLDEADRVPAKDLEGELEHERRWPAEHWKLAFQGRLRIVSEADAALLLNRMRAAAGAPA